MARERKGDSQQREQQILDLVDILAPGLFPADKADKRPDWLVKKDMRRSNALTSAVNRHIERGCMPQTVFLQGK